MGKRKRPMPSFYGKNIAQHAQRRFLARWEAEHRKKSNRILIAEDEVTIARALKVMLEKNKYAVDMVHNGNDALDYIQATTYDALVLDIMMPRMDGITMTVKLREKYDFPVIFLSAKSEEVDKIMGLNMGADDYVTKPFTPMELLARVNSQLRRYRNFMGRLKEKEEKEHIYTIGGLELNEDRKAVSVDGEDVKVTPTEYKILLLLMKHPGRVFSADEIYEWVWEEEAVNTDTIMVHVRNIREKIEINPKEPKYLKVVWGVGYKIEKQA